MGTNEENVVAFYYVRVAILVLYPLTQRCALRYVHRIEKEVPLFKHTVFWRVIDHADFLQFEVEESAPHVPPGITHRSIFDQAAAILNSPGFRGRQQ